MNKMWKKILQPKKLRPSLALSAAMPKHVGLILDGNRRWARARKLSALRGHNAGLRKIEEIVRSAFDAGVEFVSLFVFSVENWRRSTQEVEHLMKLVVRFIKKEGERLAKEGVRFQIAGRVDKTLSPEVRGAIAHMQKISAKNKGPTVVICFNYGGHLEILDMVKKIVRKKVALKDIDLELLEQNLYTPSVPALDLIIRTSGEQRLSGFQLWRTSYAELIFVKKHWPDFTKNDMAKALATYQKRQRRFGGN